MVQAGLISDAKSFLQNLLDNKGINVWAIALFGSFLESNHHDESDIDLIIISDDFEKKDAFERVEMVTGVELALLLKFRKPFDLLLKTKTEYAALRQKLLLKAEII